MTYVNLQLNPERHTGYTGPSARRIWDAIYSENCPRCEYMHIKFTLCKSSIYIMNFLNHLFCEDAYGETCPEKKVLYKLISGLHSSISIHIAADYLLDETTNQVHVMYISYLWKIFCNMRSFFVVNCMLATITVGSKS